MYLTERVCVNPLNKLNTSKKQLIQKAEENPDELREELMNQMKVVIKLGNKMPGKGVKPEKELYKNLRDMSEPVESEELKNYVEAWATNRGLN